jgi:hypothetical protein
MNTRVVNTQKERVGVLKNCVSLISAHAWMEEAIHHVPCPYRVSRCGEGVSGVQTQSSQSGIVEEDALILEAGAESRMQGGTKNSKWIVERVTTG